MKIYAAEPMPGEQVQGLRSLDEGFVPEIFDASMLDGKFLVSTAESIEALREADGNAKAFSPAFRRVGLLAVARAGG